MSKHIKPKDIHVLLASNIYEKLPYKTRENMTESEFADYILNLLINTGDLQTMKIATAQGESHGFKNSSMLSYEEDEYGNKTNQIYIPVVYPTKEAFDYVETLINVRLHDLNKQKEEVKPKTNYNDQIRFCLGNAENNITENPFHVLEASITDNRRKIASLCEDKSLYFDSKICEEARTILITPQRRLSAEMHWFPDCSPSEIQALLSYIEDSAKDPDAESGSMAHLCALSQLNAYIGSFSGKKTSTYQGLKRDILRISRLFEDLNPEEIRMLLNEKRTIAGFPQIESINDINSIIAEIRSEIRKTITQKLGGLNQEQYIEFVTTISESYSSKRNKGQAILEDIIAEYELRINDALEEKAKKIIRMADFIAKGADKIDVDSALKDLLAALSSWDKLAQPMQLGALTKGDAHRESAEMFRTMRNLSLELNNTFHLSEQALTINSAMQTVFAEMPEQLAILKEDEETLKDLIQGNRAYEQFTQNIKTLEDLISAAKNCYGRERREKINSILSVLKELDALIQNNITGEDCQKTRENLGLMVRGLAIELANNKKDYETSLYIIEELIKRYPYGAFTNLASKLTLDRTTLKQMIQVQGARVGYQNNSYNSTPPKTTTYSGNTKKEKSRGSTFVTVVLILALITGIGYAFYQQNGYKTSPSQPSKTPYSSKTTYSTSITLDKEGGTGGTASITANNGSPMPSATAPSKSGYTFKGYYSSANGYGTKYYDANMKSVHFWDKTSSSATLYAYWHQIDEKVFSQSASSGELVYIDTKSVFPSYTITTEHTRNGVKTGVTTLSGLILECDNSKYVYITFSDYKKYIDPNASETSFLYSSYADEVSFPMTKRIHGTATLSENQCSGLSGKIGKMVLKFSNIENAPSKNSSNTTNYGNGNTTVNFGTSTGAGINSSRPQNGKVFYYRYADQPCELEIINKKDEDMYCKFVDENGNDTNRFYVRANSTATFPIPVGVYTLKFATGITWVNETSLFGSGTEYFKDPETYTCSWGTKWTVTYYTSSGSSYSSTAPKTIPASQF